VDGGFPQALAQLMEGSLGQQREGHTPVADVEIMGARLPPAQFLMIVKKLFDMPAFGKMVMRGSGPSSVVVLTKPLY